MTNEIIIQAIQKITPNAEVSVSNGDINTIVWENGTTPISIADIQAQIPVVEQEATDAETKKANDKTSADAKLKALGLTDDEIEALRS